MTKFYLSLSRYLTVLLMLLSTVAWSQSKTVTGKVVSADDDSGLPGVSILEKGTTNGTVTNADGSFSVNVKDNATLVFSFVGFTSQEVAVGSQSTLSVTLQPNVTALSEVVVIGYGEVSKKDATGAVAVVKSADFNGGIIANPEQLIQGKTAGVQITNTTGNPGDGVQIRIRGTTSIRSNNNPLFVVDGVPLSGQSQSASADVGFGSSSDTNPLNFLNPNDIESISILKDASATAIYGSRGANGVVIITTKKGKGKGALEFSSNLSISAPQRRYDLLNRTEFLAAVQQYGGDPVARDAGSDTDWQDYITRTAISNKQNLSYSRGFKTGVVRASFSYDDQQGILQNSFMKRTSGRLNGTKSFFKEKLNLDLSATYSHVNREDPPISGNAGFQGDILGAAYSANPTWPTDPDFNPGGQRSPANMLEYYKSTGFTNRGLISATAEYKITSALSAKATYGLDASDGERLTLLSGKSINAGNNITGVGKGQLNHNANVNNLGELYMTYNKKAGDLDVNLVGGYSVQSFRNKYDWGVAKGFKDFSFGAMENSLRNSFDAGNAAAGAVAGGGITNNWGISDDLRGGTQTKGGFASLMNVDEHSFNTAYFARPSGMDVTSMAANFYDQTDYLQSYFARGNFTYKGKYLLTATIRRDGSSKFGPDKRYGTFPSASVAWQIHEEGFLPAAVSTLKLRAGYGVTGNQDGLGYGNFRRRDRYSDASVGDANEVNVPGTNTQGAQRNSLQWESTAQSALGLDFGFMNNKLSGTIDYYDKETSHLLLSYFPAQPYLGSIVFTNLPDATVQNKGWEFTLSYQAISTDDASLSFTGNVSHNKNMLNNFNGQLQAGQIYGQGLSGAYAEILAGGHPLFSYHLRDFQGFDENGQPVGDIQGFVGKSALPTWNSGLSINGRYKNFDLAIYFAGQFGQYIYNNTRNGFFTAGSINNARNVTKDVVTNGEAGSAEAPVSTRFLEKGDFVRLQNLSIGYNLPMSGTGAIKKLRFSLTGQNVFLITKYTGLDPEVSSSPASYSLLNQLPTAGIDYGAYPKPRTFTIGLMAAF